MTAGAELRPTITHVNKLPGSGAVTRRGSFRPEMLRLEEQGMVHIPHDVLSSNVDYVQVFRNRKGKKVHCTIFQTPVESADGTIQFRHDPVAYSKFLTLLRRKRIIKPPEPQIVDGVREQYRVRLQSRLSREPQEGSARMQEHKRQVAYLNRCLEVLDNEYEASVAHYGEPASEGREALDRALAALDALDEEFQATGPAPAKSPSLTQGARKGLTLLDELSSDSDDAAPVPSPGLVADGEEEE